MIAAWVYAIRSFTMSPDQKGIETRAHHWLYQSGTVHNEPRSKGD